MNFEAGPARQVSRSRDLPIRIEDRLIVALDVPSIDEARTLVVKLDGVASFFKIGYWLQFSAASTASSTI